MSGHTIFTVAEVREYYDQLVREEITFSRFVELLNQRPGKSTEAIYAIEVPQNKLYQLYTKEQIINAHIAGQRNAGVDPSYNQALEYYEQEKKEAPKTKCEHTYVDVAGWNQCSKCGDVFY